MKVKNEKGKNITTFNEHLDKRYGKAGSKTRNKFEARAKTLAREIIKGEERLTRH